MTQAETTVLSHYPVAAHPVSIDCLGNAGGFSGARLWRVSTSKQVLCLRRWPAEHPKLERLLLIHHVLRSISGNGLNYLPAPIETRSGDTYVDHQGHLYELTPWLPGTADFQQNPTDLRLQAALRATAQFHLLAAVTPGFEQFAGLSPGLAERRTQVSSLRESDLKRLENAVRGASSPKLVPLAREVLALATPLLPEIERALRVAEETPLPLQPSIRDLRSDHFLFEGDTLTGLVDFGSLRVESPVGDVARGLGSLVGDDHSRRASGLAAYEAIRPLHDQEWAVLSVFDHSEVVLSSLNWLDWIFCQGRQFEDQAAVLARIEQLVRRLRRLANQGGFWAGQLD